MRPLLRQDTYFAPVRAGAYWLTHTGPVMVTGEHVAEWVQRLAPFLDGSQSLADLLAGLPPDRAEFVDRLVRTMAESGVVRDAPQIAPPATRTLMPFAGEVDFIGYFADSAVARFERYRTDRTLLIGAGQSLVACVAAGLRSGLGAPAVVVTDECATDVDRLNDVLARLRQGAPAKQIDPILAGDPEYHELMRLIDGARTVLHVSDRFVPARASVLARACVDSGARLAEAFVDGDGAWIGLLSSGTDRDAMWRRVRGRPDVGGDQPVTADSAAMAVLADQVVHRIFRKVTGVDRGVDEDGAHRRVYRLDFPSLRTSSHRVLPHPYARPARPRSAAEFRHEVSVLSTQARLDPQEFSVGAAAVVDGRTGPLLSVSEREFAQLPLHVCEVRVAVPSGLLGRAEVAVPVTAAGPDFATARHRAALRAFAAYCSMVVDPRLLLAGNGSGAPISVTDPEEAVGALVAGRLEGRLWGTRMADGQPCQVDVRTVFPVLRSRAEHDVVASGVFAGYDWADAVSRGLVDRCRELTVAELGHSGAPLPILPLDVVRLDEAGSRYRRLIEALGEPVTAYDVTGTSAVPTFAFCLGDTTVCYTSALSTADAVREGMEQVLLAFQAASHRQSAYAPPKVPQLPRSRRGDGHAGRWGPPREDIDLATAATRLRDRGLTAVAVPLDHDPEMSRIMPYVAQVVLIDE
jgi:hypothetical protein